MDFAMPNAKPGRCCKCSGSGVYKWQTTDLRGQTRTVEGKCYSCGGEGVQTPKQIRRNHAYNRHKAASVLASDFR